MSRNILKFQRDVACLVEELVSQDEQDVCRLLVYHGDYSAILEKSFDRGMTSSWTARVIALQIDNAVAVERLVQECEENVYLGQDGEDC